MRTHLYTKKLKLTFAAVILGSAAFAQGATFDDLTLAPNSYNDGSTGSGNFVSGNVLFENSYNSTWGFWDGGFAYSNQADTTTSASDYMTQLYQTKAGSGNSSSANFAIGTQNSRFRLQTPDHYLYGVYVTNTTYAYNSMALGDGFSKKFGDTSATAHSAAGINQGYPDWLKLSAFGYNGGVVTDTLDFYLADFRFADNAQDYIVKDWQYFNLMALGHVDSVEFIMSSSDNGAFGMNTPAYYCIDDLLAVDVIEGVNTLSNPSGVNVYPNPFENSLSVDFKNTNSRVVNVYNAFGQLLSSEKTNESKAELNFNGFNSGIYFVNVIEAGKSSTTRVIKK